MDSNGVQHANLRDPAIAFPACSLGREQFQSQVPKIKGRWLFKVSTFGKFSQSIASLVLKTQQAYVRGSSHLSGENTFFAILKYLVIPNPLFLVH